MFLRRKPSAGNDFQCSPWVSESLRLGQFSTGRYGPGSAVTRLPLFRRINTGQSNLPLNARVVKHRDRVAVKHADHGAFKVARAKSAVPCQVPTNNIGKGPGSLRKV